MSLATILVRSTAARDVRTDAAKLAFIPRAVAPGDATEPELRSANRGHPLRASAFRLLHQIDMQEVTCLMVLGSRATHNGT